MGWQIWCRWWQGWEHLSWTTGQCTGAQCTGTGNNYLMPKTSSRTSDHGVPCVKSCHACVKSCQEMLKNHFQIIAQCPYTLQNWTNSGSPVTSVSVLHQCAFAAPAYSMSNPINYFPTWKTRVFVSTALPQFKDKHNDFHPAYMYAMHPSDAIRVMVGLKISRVGGKIGQSSPPGPAWPAWPPLFSADRPRCTADLPDIMQNASVCILAKETAGLRGIFHWERNTLLKGVERKRKPECSHGHASHLILGQLCNCGEGEYSSRCKSPRCAVCSTLIEAFFKDLCYQTKFHSSLTGQTNFSASDHES